jgi:hypothetical protein
MSIGDLKTNVGRCDSEGLYQTRQSLVQDTAVSSRDPVAPRRLMAHFCRLAFWLFTGLVSLRLPGPRQYGALHR